MKLIIFCILLTACGDNILPPPYTFITNHGIRVDVGRMNTPNQSMVEAWTNETLEFWYKQFPCKRLDDIDILAKVYAFFIDQDYVNLWGDAYGGAANYEAYEFDDVWYSRIIISNGTRGKVRGVFAHELSHILIFYWSDWISSDESHELFAKFGLDSTFTY